METIFHRDHSILYCGYGQVSKKTLLQDLKTLLTAYAKQETTSFAIFKKVWEEMRFYLIHYACEDHIHGRGVFMEYLYSQLIHFYMKSKTIQRKVAVIHGLYFLYETQPKRPYTYPIPATIEFWSDLGQFCSDLIKNPTDYHDAIFLLHEMVNVRRNEMFRFVSGLTFDKCDEKEFLISETRNGPNDIHEMVKGLELQVLSQPDSLPSISLTPTEYSRYLDVLEKIGHKVNNHENIHLLSELDLLSRELEREKNSCLSE